MLWSRNVGRLHDTKNVQHP